MHYFDLDLGPMTLELKLDLDVVVTYFHAKHQVNRSSNSKVINWIHRQTDTHTQTQREKGEKPLPARFEGRKITHM